MSLFIRILVVVVMAACAAPGRAAPPAEMADLFPPGTIAYMEVHNPAELAPQLALVFKGSALEDSIPFIHGRKDAAKTVPELANKRQLALLGLLASPEMLGEFKKLRIAGGITGFTGQGDAEFALVILTHDSPAVGLAARAYLTMSPQLRKVAEVSKVPVFQYRTPNINYDPNGNPIIQNEKAFSDGPHEMTLAYTPGLIAIGTSKNAVGYAIKRFLGEEKAAGLASVPAFKDAAVAHRQTGVFFYVNYPEFAKKLVSGSPHWATLGGVGAQGIDDWLGQLTRFVDSDLFQVFKMTANPKAVTSLAGNIRFRDGGIAATVVASFDPAQKSPLLDVLSGPGVKVEMLHHSRHPSTLALAVTFPEKNRAAAVIGFLDAVAKASGELGRLPHDVVKEFEEKYKLSVNDALLDKLSAATVIMPTRQELPKGGKPGPLLVLHAADATVAAAWEEFLPKLFGDLGGAATVPLASTETIGGVKVFSVPGTGLRWNAPVHFARNGTVVALGLDRKLVAAAVTADAAASAIGGDRAVSPPAEPGALFGVISLGDALVGLFETPRAEGPVVPATVPAIFPNGQPIPESLIEDMMKSKKELLAALGTMPQAKLTARRTGNQLRIELFQPKAQTGGLKVVIDAAANWIDRSASIAGSNGRNGDYEIIKGRW